MGTRRDVDGSDASHRAHARTGDAAVPPSFAKRERQFMSASRFRIVAAQIDTAKGLFRQDDRCRLWVGIWARRIRKSLRPIAMPGWSTSNAHSRHATPNGKLKSLPRWSE